MNGISVIIKGQRRQVWGYALERLRKEDLKFEVKLDSIMVCVSKTHK